MSRLQSSERWFPTAQQLNHPRNLERAFRQLLAQHYQLLDAHAQLKAKVDALPLPPVPQNGPTNTVVLGLNVAPVDTLTLKDGAVLTFVKANGDLEFK